MNPIDPIQTPAFLALGYASGTVALLVQLSATQAGLQTGLRLAFLSNIAATQATFAPGLAFEALNSQAAGYDYYTPGTSNNALEIVYDAYCSGKCY